MIGVFKTSSYKIFHFKRFIINRKNTYTIGIILYSRENILIIPRGKSAAGTADHDTVCSECTAVVVLHPYSADSDHLSDCC